MRGMNIGIGIIAILIVFLFSGCKSTNAELEENKQVWRRKAVKNYAFTLQNWGGGSSIYRPERIEVRDGKVISRKTIDGEPQYNNYDGYSKVETVEKMFYTVHQAYDKGESVKIEYNPEYGFPEKFVIGTINRPVDAHFAIDVTDFSVITN